MALGIDLELAACKHKTSVVALPILKIKVQFSFLLKKNILSSLLIPSKKLCKYMLWDFKNLDMLLQHITDVFTKIVKF